MRSTTTQDRLAEKTFLADLGIADRALRRRSTRRTPLAALDRLGRPGVLKTRRFGYDGKGQIDHPAGRGSARRLEELGRTPCILEGFVPFEREVSVVAAAVCGGAFAAYDLCANEHHRAIFST